MTCGLTSRDVSAKPAGENRTDPISDPPSPATLSFPIEFVVAWPALAGRADDALASPPASLWPNGLGSDTPSLTARRCGLAVTVAAPFCGVGSPKLSDVKARLLPNSARLYARNSCLPGLLRRRLSDDPAPFSPVPLSCRPDQAPLDISYTRLAVPRIGLYTSPATPSPTPMAAPVNPPVRIPSAGRDTRPLAASFMHCLYFCQPERAPCANDRIGSLLCFPLQSTLRYSHLT
mmetsp:Transcript_16379/g.33306  ORF Transcript_16379/g.33306 Transcript_16379/m.33306 type:complete len:233 (-) Transcript_16379:414-1112(-)